MAYTNKPVPTSAKQHLRHGACFAAVRTRWCCATWFENYSCDCDSRSRRGARGTARHGSGLLCRGKRAGQQKPQEERCFGNSHRAALRFFTLPNGYESWLRGSCKTRTALGVDICQRIRIHLRVTPARGRADLGARKPEHTMQIGTIELRTIQ